MTASRWAVAGVGSVAVLAFAVPVLPMLALPAGGLLSGNNAGGACSVAIAPGTKSGWTADQLGIARAALQVTAQRHLPARALLVILAAGLQESGLHNLTSGDRDSVGWLQQRAGWGSLAERMNPAVAAGKFFNALVQVPGWQTLPVTLAAQAVQISAFPNAYAKWESDARQLAAMLGSAPADQCGQPAIAGTRTLRDVESGKVWHIPIPAGKAGVAVNAALDQLGKRYVWNTHGPDTFDCSGLVSYAWGRAGVSVFPQTEVEWQQEPRATGPAQAGDLWGWPGHVQMYLYTDRGQPVIVEAANPSRPIHIVYEYQTPTRKLRPYAAAPTGVARP